MATLKEAMYALLSADAQLTGSSNLGHSSLLGQSSASPYGVFWRHPPEDFDFNTYSSITYFISTIAPAGQEEGRDVFFDLTAWGANFEAIQERIYDLLNRTQVTTTDVKTLLMKWYGATPESFDEFRRITFQVHRYRVRVWKI